MIMGDAGETYGLIDSLFTPIEKEAYGRSKIIRTKEGYMGIAPAQSQPGTRKFSPYAYILDLHGLRLTGDDPIHVKEKNHRGGYQL